MSTYVLENNSECDRLEKMSKISAYSPAEEVYKIKFKKGDKVLDAGCGSGLVARHIANTYPDVKVSGCDQSAVRVEQAQKIRKSEGKNDISFFQSELENIKVDNNSFDVVTCRYVFEFLKDPQKVLSEFLRILKPGGQLLIIQFDGFIYNFMHSNAKLASSLEKLEKNLGMDMFLGRKIPSLMRKAGFSEIDWDVKVYGFKNQDLEGEKIQMYERFNFALPILEKVLGSRPEAVQFINNYCDEMLKPDSVLFYNKFLVSGKK